MGMSRWRVSGSVVDFFHHQRGSMAAVPAVMMITGHHLTV